MWIMNTLGFFSVVQCAVDEVMIRARVERDLERMLAALEDYNGEEEPKILTTLHADYPFRIIVKKEAFARYTADAIRNIDYGNFKSEVAKTDPVRSHRVYGEIWSVLREGLDPRARGLPDPLGRHRTPPMRNLPEGELPFPEAAMGGPSMPTCAYVPAKTVGAPAKGTKKTATKNARR